MFSLKKQKGFTIVELLIVIVVIGILATLVIVTFSGIQQRGRNSQRETDLKAVQSHVAAFHAEKGYYPTLADLQSATFRSANMKGLDAEALRDPRQAAGGTIGATASGTQYSYVASASASSSGTCDNTAASADTNSGCDTYTLTAHREGGSNIVLSSN
jgi:prepilin-type N-terminal cleavage/methylation domain-containing protein